MMLLPTTNCDQNIAKHNAIYCKQKNKMNQLC